VKSLIYEAMRVSADVAKDLIVVQRCADLKISTFILTKDPRLQLYAMLGLQL